MKPEDPKATEPRKPFVEPKIERHGKLPEITGISIPADGISTLADQ